ncbi:hypothetical protein [Rubripirellula tenax]|uniref:hypothetical protein n=1 Tax=Rubripirellula tenax TaxID=2528015 RepID=UPI0011B570A9|nr:hypothetical protein [Rubripirellula tenax]
MPAAGRAVVAVAVVGDVGFTAAGARLRGLGGGADAITGAGRLAKSFDFGAAVMLPSGVSPNALRHLGQVTSEATLGRCNLSGNPHLGHFNSRVGFIGKDTKTEFIGLKVENTDLYH